MRPSNGDATVEFVPAARIAPPAYKTDDIVVGTPKEVPRRAYPNPVIRFLPVVTALAAVVVTAAVFHSRTGATRNPAFLLFPVMMLVSAAATVASGADRRGGDVNSERAEYLRHLAELRTVAVENAAAQRESLIWSYPEPEALWTLVGGCRMWERRASADDFCHVRIGIGRRDLASRVVAPTIVSARQLDPVTIGAMRRFVDVHSTVAALPVVIRLSGVVHLIGETAPARALLRSIICQLAVTHSPGTVLIAAAVTDRSRPDWDWLKWLPHNRHPYIYDDAGPFRMIYPSAAEAGDALAAAAIVERLVLIGDDGVSGITLTMMDSATAGVSRFDVSSDQVVAEGSSGEKSVARPDQMSCSAALACAHRLAGYRAGDVDAATTHAVRWQDLVGIECFSATDCWNTRHSRDRLRVPVGVTADGVTVELDIKEAAENGMGPHGLCIGATGSGKSEFLRTVVLGMIALHSPEAINLVLIDFKGGATFAGLESAPHVAAVITNLADKAAMVSRMRDALMGEMNRRQELLRAAGDIDGSAAYERARQSRADLCPLPALFIVVDEFSELLSQQPDFADTFAAIGRLGRSLGMHLLLASQRLDEGRLRGLESHLSYRVCLKTLSVNESRIVLGTSEAYELPSTPGAAILRVGRDAAVRFQTAHVSGPGRDVVAQRGGRGVCSFTTAAVGVVTAADAVDDVGLSTLQTVVKRMADYRPRAHAVWLPPLDASPCLDGVLVEAQPLPTLTIPIGCVDRPFEQRRTPLLVDLSGAAGNVAVVGGPQSGKSTALSTLITALAVTHDPRMVQFYCLDFGGGALSSLRDLPQVGSVAGRMDTELVPRMITEMAATIRSREILFRDQGIESMTHYRQLKERRDPICDRFGDVFLVIDGWAAVQREFEMAENAVIAIAAEGLSFGVHVVLSAARWADIRPAVRDQIGTRIELRLGDSADSEIDRRQAHQVPQGKPGRGLSQDGLHMIIAMPTLDADRCCAVLVGAEGSAPPIALLPRQVEHASLAGRVDDGVLLGVQEGALRPVSIHFGRHPHLLIIGDGECGKTATLRTVCRELLRPAGPGRCELLIVDVRRSLLDIVGSDSELLGGYLASAPAADEATRRLVAELRRRLPPSNATPTQLRDRSWWAGPEIYVVVDDYELVSTSLAPLAELLPYARDIGLHLVIARRSGGAVRAMFEPLLAGLRDGGGLTLLMSGSPDDGLIVGSVRPSPMPPGRGTLIAPRSEPRLVQVGWCSPS